MMIFLDSSFLIAMEVESDNNHHKAVKIRDKIINNQFGGAVISDYVFDEIVTVTLYKTKDIKKAVFVGENLRKSLEIIKVDDSIFSIAWQIFSSQKNTSLSFTDCTILAIMKEKKIKSLATFDNEFKKIDEVSIIKG